MAMNAPVAPPRFAASARGRMGQALGMLPAATIGLVIAALAGLLWYLDADEREQQRRALINDTLWVEQSLQFALQSDADDILRLASDIRQGLTPAEAAPRIELLLRNNPEIAAFAWFDSAGAARLARPGAPPAAPGATVALASRSGKPAWSPVRRVGDETAFDFVAPLYSGADPAGQLVASFSIDELLDNHIPWWVAQKYQVEFRDLGGEPLGRRSVATPPPGAASHTLAFDPPGGGLSLTVTRLDTRTSLAANALVAMMVALSALAIASLVLTRRQMLRRGAAEAALNEEHALRKAMEESLTVGMRARDAAGRIIYVNQAFCRMVGWSAAELVGCAPPMPYWVPEDMERTMRLHEMVLEGRAPGEGFEIKFRRRNGERFDALVYEAPLIDGDGRRRGWMGSVVDITERKKMEELARRQSEKLAQTARLVTMGEMASTLAHELNQPLAAISNYANGSRKLLAGGRVKRAELQAVFEKLAAQAQRAGQVVRRVRDFVRKSDPKFQALDLAELVGETLDFVKPELRSRGIAVTREGDARLPACSGDRILLEQVLLNLVRNAIEAMADAPKRDRRLTIAHTAGDGEVVVRVADRGKGLSPAIRENLFVPFATTKAEGMGMGLNICRTIIELHRGRLWFEDRPGGGSVFAFAMPEMRP
jgi:two-component system sensor histidine kinase DctS